MIIEYNKVRLNLMISYLIISYLDIWAALSWSLCAKIYFLAFLLLKGRVASDKGKWSTTFLGVTIEFAYGYQTLELTR